MTDYTHADLLAAIDKARPDHPDDLLALYVSAKNAHLDTLRAILDLHLVSDYCCDVLDEPVCPTVQVVADALRTMGALDE